VKKRNKELFRLIIFCIFAVSAGLRLYHSNQPITQTSSNTPAVSLSPTPHVKGIQVSITPAEKKF